MLPGVIRVFSNKLDHNHSLGAAGLVPAATAEHADSVGRCSRGIEVSVAR